MRRLVRGYGIEENEEIGQRPAGRRKGSNWSEAMV